MFSSTVRMAAETVGEATPVDPAELVPLAELAGEGFGWGGQFVKTPRDAVDALSPQLDGEVVLDDLGRRCVSREAARRLFSERAEVERRQREAQQRHEEELAEQAANNRPEAASRPTRSPTAFRRRPRCCRPPATRSRAASRCSRRRWPTATVSPTAPSGADRDQRPTATSARRRRCRRRRSP